MNYKVIYLFLCVFPALFIGCEKGKEEPEAKNEPFDKFVTAIAVNEANVFVGTFENGLYKLEDGNWHNMTTADGLLSNEITALEPDGPNRMWVGTRQGLSKLENENWTHYTTADGLFNDHVRCLESDADHTIWVGTYNNRLTRFDGAEFITYHVNPESSGEMEMGHIHTITCAPDGNVWVGSCISGLSMFNGTNWSHKINNLNVFVESSAYTKNGEVWAGHYTGAYQLKDGIWVHHSETNGLINNQVLCIDIGPDGHVWVGTIKGVSEYDGEAWTNYTFENDTTRQVVPHLACSSDGSIWAGNAKGLWNFWPE